MSCLSLDNSGKQVDDEGHQVVLHGNTTLILCVDAKEPTKGRLLWSHNGETGRATVNLPLDATKVAAIYRVDW